jgi:hypothetical protein
VLSGGKMDRYEDLLRMCAQMLRQWKLLHKEDANKLEQLAMDLEARGIRPPRITWVAGMHQQASASESFAHESERVGCIRGNETSVNNAICDSETLCGVCKMPIMAVN